jgi:hypothetical protein
MDFVSDKLALENSLPSSPTKMIHIRALFSYVPQEDIYLPCKEIGLSFNKGDILHIISQVVKLPEIFFF